jgi:hypothetical protein
LKHLLLLSLILSTSAFAIDFNKATGSFDVEEKSIPVGEDTVAAASWGSFDLTEGKSRAPASVEQKEKATVGVNDLTGTFQ